MAGPADTAFALAGGRRLPLPSENNVEPNEREVRWANLTGPADQRVRVAEQMYVFGDGKAAQRYSVAVAGKLSEVEDNLAAFRTQLIQALALAGIGLLAVTLFQVRFGLFPLSRMEQDLAAIRSGEADPARRRACPPRSSLCSRSSTRCSSPTRRSSSVRAPTSAISRTR